MSSCKDVNKDTEAKLELLGATERAGEASIKAGKNQDEIEKVEVYFRRD